MKDFYQRLKLPPDATEEAIGHALARAEPELRTAAEFILLHPARRQVYDRNHRLLMTIAQLRMNLGLNYTRFWARQEYKDFAAEAMPKTERRGKPVSSMMIAHAIARVGRTSRKHIVRPRNWAISLGIGAFLAGAALLWWCLNR